jgi:hypothetical protein
LLEGIQKSKRKGHLCATLAEICLKREELEMAVRGAIRAVELGTDLYIAYHLVAQLLDRYGEFRAKQRVLSGVPTELEPRMVDRIRRLSEQQDSEVVKKLVETFAAELRQAVSSQRKATSKPREKPDREHDGFDLRMGLLEKMAKRIHALPQPGVTQTDIWSGSNGDFARALERTVEVVLIKSIAQQLAKIPTLDCPGSEKKHLLAEERDRMEVIIKVPGRKTPEVMFLLAMQSIVSAAIEHRSELTEEERASVSAVCDWLSACRFCWNPITSSESICPTCGRVLDWGRPIGAGVVGILLLASGVFLGPNIYSDSWRAVVTWGGSLSGGLFLFIAVGQLVVFIRSGAFTSKPHREKSQRLKPVYPAEEVVSRKLKEKRYMRGKEGKTATEIERKGDTPVHALSNSPSSFAEAGSAREKAIAWWNSPESARSRSRGYAICDMCNKKITQGEGLLVPGEMTSKHTRDESRNILTDIMGLPGGVADNALGATEEAMAASPSVICESCAKSLGLSPKDRT